MKKTKKLLALLLALLLTGSLLTACGGSEDEVQEDAQDQTTEDTQSGDSTETDWPTKPINWASLWR